MQKLTNPLLAISFLLVFGCAPKAKLVANSEVAIAVNPYFSDAAQDYAYRAKIAVYGHELNGILIAKKISDSIHRVVLTTDFGNTLLDFEVGQSSFKKHAIVEDLDRKIIVNTLRDDFRLLFREQYPIPDIRQSVGDSSVFVTEGRNHYRISFSGTKLISISKGSRKKEMVSIGFHGESDTFAERIAIRHYDIQLSIGMTRLEP